MSVRRAYGWNLAQMTALIFSLIGLSVAVRLITFSLSDLLTRTEPTVALLLDGGNAAAHVNRAEILLSTAPPDLPAARAEASQALARDPLSSRALQRLARIAEAEEDAEAAASLMRASSEATRRDLLAQAWLMSRAIDTNDPSSAIARLDIMFRGQNPNIWDAIAPPVVPLLMTADYVEPLADFLLATDPPWGPWLLDALPRWAASPDNFDQSGSAIRRNRAGGLDRRVRLPGRSMTGSDQQSVLSGQEIIDAIARNLGGKGRDSALEGSRESWSD